MTARVSVCRREMYRPLRLSSIKPSIHWFSTTVVWAWRVKAATTATSSSGSRRPGGAITGMQTMKRVASLESTVSPTVSRLRL